MIYLASDHAGFQLKKFVKSHLKSVLRVAHKDLGPKKYEKTDDYPDFAVPAAKAAAKKVKDRAILICGMGNGMVIAANKVKGVRAIMGYSIESAVMGRRDEDANVLCLAERVLSHEHAAAIIKAFLQTPADPDDRHVRRRKKLAKLD